MTGDNVPTDSIQRLGMEETALDHHTGMPLYRQIYMILRNRIQSGEISSGSMLPGEMNLSKDFSVSRITCKRALNELASDGYVVRQRGLGTRVLDRTRPAPVRASIEGWLENVSTMGRTTKVKVIDFGYVSAPQGIAEALEIEDGVTVQRAVRLRLLGGEPMSYLVTHVPEDLGHAFSRRDLVKMPMLELLERAGVTVASAWQSISAAIAEPAVADALGVTAGSALIDVRRVVCDDAGRAVEHIQIYYRPDLYCMEMSMKRVEGEEGKTWSSTPRPKIVAGAAG